MIKQTLFVFIFVGLFVTSTPTIAMYGNILKAVQVCTGGSLIVGGMLLSKKKYNRFQEPFEGGPVPLRSEKFIRAVMKECGDSEADTLFLARSKRVFSWSSNLKTIAGSVDEINKLESNLFFNNQNSEDCLKLSMSIKHEIGHRKLQHFYQEVVAWALMPVVVVGSHSGIRRTFNNFFHIKSPTRLFSTIFRSSVSIGSILPKAALSYLGLIWLDKFQEKEADRFACMHANSREELESFKDFFIEMYVIIWAGILSDEGIDIADRSMKEQRLIHHLLVSSAHPHPLDRAAMIQQYIDKWDEEHKD